MNDKYADFLKILGKMLRYPQMSLTKEETELIKECLLQILDNNSNYGPQTKRVFKLMLNEAKHPMDLALEVEAYIATHDVAQ